MAQKKMIVIIVDQRCQQLISQDHLIKGEKDNHDKELGSKTLKEEFMAEFFK